MKTFLIFLIWIACAGFASAQDATMRSGEHGRFTRLVIDVPPGTDWVLDPEDGTDALRLRLPDDLGAVDTQAVFRRIDRQRVRDVQALGAGDVRIELACPCSTEAFALGDRMIVIDVFPPDPETDPTQRQGPEPTVIRSNNIMADLTRPRIGTAPGLGPGATRPIAPPLLPLDFDRDDTDAAALDAARQSLVRQIATGASTGVLKAAPQFTAASPARNADRQTASVESASPDSADNRSDDPANRDLSIMRDAEGRVLIGVTDCTSDETLDLSDALGTEAPMDDLAALRSDLYGEFDTPDSAAINAYARALLSAGFGAEARDALALLDDAPQPALMAMTWLVDTETDPSRHFVGQETCPTAAALWAILASDESGPFGAVSDIDVLRAFEGLPLTLREHLGPSLARKLSAVGETELGREILRRLQRARPVPTDRMRMAEAFLGLQAGDFDKAQKALEQLEKPSGAFAEDAVSMAVEVAIESGEPVPAELSDLSAAFATELRGTPQEARHRAALVRSLVSQGAFDAALAELSQIDAAGESDASALTDDVMAALARDAEDVVFLKHALVPPQGTSTAPRTAQAIADRLITLGFPQNALDWLDNAEAPADPMSDRILRARALIDLDRPEEADLLLIGLSGPESTRLRADARRRMGDHAFAAAVYEQAGLTDSADKAAWLAADWERLAGQSGSAFAPVARLLREPSSALPIEPALSDLETLGAQAAETQDTVRALLDATALPDDR